MRFIGEPLSVKVMLLLSALRKDYSSEAPTLRNIHEIKFSTSVKAELIEFWLLDAVRLNHDR